MVTTSTDTTIFEKISLRIIREQEFIIGPIAWDEARKVSGLHIADQRVGQVRVEGNPSEVLDRLVSQYSRLFGQASTEACREAVRDLIVELPADQVPSTLQ